MKELAIAIRNYDKDNYKQIIDCIKNTGFKNVFIEWYNYDYELQENILKYVRKSGLNVIFAHLGYQNANAIWLDGEFGDRELERYINDINICKNNGIDLVIIHPTRKYDDPGVSKIGIERVKKLVEYGEKIGVRIAFENVELEKYLSSINDNIQSDNLGICFDIGHCNLFFGGEIDTDKYKNRVFAIHLHDNFKEKDDHNLPFDGTVDWDRAIKQLKELNYNSYITVESGKNDFYENLSYQEYYELAYQRGMELIRMIDS